MQADARRGHHDLRLARDDCDELVVAGSTRVAAVGVEEIAGHPDDPTYDGEQVPTRKDLLREHFGVTDEERAKALTSGSAAERAFHAEQAAEAQRGARRVFARLVREGDPHDPLFRRPASPSAASRARGGHRGAPSRRPAGRPRRASTGGSGRDDGEPGQPPAAPSRRGLSVDALALLVELDDWDGVAYLGQLRGSCRDGGHWPGGRRFSRAFVVALVEALAAGRLTVDAEHGPAGPTGEIVVRRLSPQGAAR